MTLLRFSLQKGAGRECEQDPEYRIEGDGAHSRPVNCLCMAEISFYIEYFSRQPASLVYFQMLPQRFLLWSFFFAFLGGQLYPEYSVKQKTFGK